TRLCRVAGGGPPPPALTEPDLWISHPALRDARGRGTQSLTPALAFPPAAIQVERELFLGDEEPRLSTPRAAPRGRPCDAKTLRARPRAPSPPRSPAPTSPRRSSPAAASSVAGPACHHRAATSFAVPYLLLASSATASAAARRLRLPVTSQTSLAG